MFDKRILRLTPKRIYCPLCGDWHDWEGKSLQSHDEDNPYELYCDGTNVRFQVYDDYIDISLDSICEEKINDRIDARIDLDDDVECDAKEPVIKFSTLVSTDDIICSSECENCMGYNLPVIGDMRSDDDDEFELNLEFKIEFASRYFDKYAKEMRAENVQQEFEEKATMQKPLIPTPSPSEAITPKENKTTAKIVKEDTTMANNIFNMNMEFGPSKDESIASTLMGVAVKNGDSWRIYDKKKKEITDIGDLQLGNLPIFILPTTKLSEGDLIKDAGEYYFVIKVEAGKTQTLCAKSGEMKTVIPIKNVLGFSCYSKVIALSDSLNLGDDFDVEKLAIMSAMCGQSGNNGNQMNQLLPLMLFKDKFNTGDDTMKLVLMSSMMNPTADGGQMNQLLPLMFLKDADGGNDDTMKLLLMSSMMGNADGNNNPMMTYLMFEMFMGKKDDEKS